MIIGVPKEIMHDENRVSSTPETVAKMVKDGFKVLVEKGAGFGSFYLDDAYQQAGAEIVADPQEIYDRANVILKVKEPQFSQKYQKNEIEMMHQGQVLITFIHPAAPVNHAIVKRMAEKKIVGLTLDGIPRISRAQSMDALSSMSVCAGYKGILMAANDTAKFMPMVGSAVGVLKPSIVLVLGTGVAGLRAVATAKSLGAVVYSADIRPEANEQAMSLGARIVDIGIPAEISVSPDGKHANKLSEEWLQIEREHLADIISKSDIVFCSALLFGQIAPVLLTEEMVKTMKPGSCIVDISIDQGGNCAITTPGIRDIKHHVIIEGIKNIPGMLPSSSTWMFAQNIYNLLKYLVKDDKIELDTSDEIVSSILVTNFAGEIVHQGALAAMQK